MRTAYKVLAWLITVEVAIQASAVVYGDAGLGIWIEEGGVLDKAAMESGESLFPEVVAFMVHGINGTMVIPVLALALLVVSFFAKLPGGVKWASFVLLAVVVQVALGMFGHVVSALGALHGINALVLATTAFWAGKRVAMVTGEPAETAQVNMPQQRRRSRRGQPEQSELV